MKKGKKTEVGLIKDIKDSTRDSIEVGSRRINYEILYSKRRKRAALMVRPDRMVEFHAPAGLEKTRIREMVRDKADWILKKLDWFEENRHPDPTKRYVQGEEFLFLGEVYHLNIIVEEEWKSQHSGKIQHPGNVSARINDQVLEVSLNSQAPGVSLSKNLPEDGRKELVREAVCRWYAERAVEKVGEFVELYSEKLRVPPPFFQVKYQRKRWGSCSAKNVIRINFQLLMASPGQLEYVVVHELCHIKEKNHSPAFWALVEELMPGYGPHREELKKDGWKYVL